MDQSFQPRASVEMIDMTQVMDVIAKHQKEIDQTRNEIEQLRVLFFENFKKERQIKSSLR